MPLLVTIQSILFQYNTLFFNASWSQYSECIAIQSSAPQAFSCNTIFPLHTSILQYNLAHCTTILQYNFPANMHSFAIQFSSCNTLTQPTYKPHCNTIPCIAIQFSNPTSLVAIQILVLQYNYLPNKPPIEIKLLPTKLYHNTI